MFFLLRRLSLHDGSEAATQWQLLSRPLGLTKPSLNCTICFNNADPHDHVVAAVARSCFHGHCIEHHRTRLALALDRKLSRLSAKKLQATTLAHANLARQGPYGPHNKKRQVKQTSVLALSCLLACLLAGGTGSGKNPGPRPTPRLLSLLCLGSERGAVLTRAQGASPSTILAAPTVTCDLPLTLRPLRLCTPSATSNARDDGHSGHPRLLPLSLSLASRR